MNALKFAPTSPLAIDPRVYDVASPGVELFSPIATTIVPGHQEKIDTCVAFEFPEGHVGIVLDKSSVVTKKRLKVDGGLIDTGYRGGIVVVLRNVGTRPVRIEIGEAVAQMIVIECRAPLLEKVRDISKSTTRGVFGFGQLSALYGSK